MSVETETQLEAFIAANSDGKKLKKIELSDLTFEQFKNYFALYANKFKDRTAFIDNVYFKLNNTAMQVFTKYDDEDDSIEFEYSSMSAGTLDNLTYVFAHVHPTVSDFSMNYVDIYMNGAFADSETLNLMNIASTISCDIYIIE